MSKVAIRLKREIRIQLPQVDIMIKADLITSQDIGNTGNFTWWVYYKDTLITSFWIKDYDFNWWFTDDDGLEFYTLVKKDGDK